MLIYLEILQVESSSRGPSFCGGLSEDFVDSFVIDMLQPILTKVFQFLLGRFEMTLGSVLRTDLLFC